MKMKLAMLTVLMMAMSSPALADDNCWGDWSGFTHWNWEWIGEQIDDDDCDGIWNKDDDCDWGWIFDRCDEDKGGDDCDWGWPKDKACQPPSSVPSPTAGLAGLGVLGLMLNRRRSKQG